MTLLVTSPLKWLGGKIDILVEVETLTPGGGVWDSEAEDHGWDEALWAVFEWSNITSYVEFAKIVRGQQRWENRHQAGSFTLHLNNVSGLFTPEVGPELNSIPWRPGRGIRIAAVPNPADPGHRVYLFTGRIDDTRDAFNPFARDVIATVRALDALGDLHAFNPLALDTATGVQDTHERVHAALDRMGWPDELRLIQAGLHTMQTSFLAQTTLEECMRAGEAEGGAVFADTQNRVVFRQRDWLAGGSASMGAYEEVTLTKAPLGYWRFQGAGTADTSGNSHTLTLFGSPVTGQEGVTHPEFSIPVADDESVRFDGTNDYANIATDTAFELRQDMTIEFWFKPKSGGTGDKCIVSRRASSDPLYEVFWDSEAERIEVYPSSGAGAGEFGPDVSPDTWHHVVVTIAWDTLRTISVWVDGTLRSRNSYSYFPGTATRTMHIGRRAIGADLYLDADLSELAIYDFVLSEAQIAQQYAAPLRDLNDRSIEVQGYLGYDSEQEAGVPFAAITDAKVSWETARIRNTVQFARTGSTVYEAVDTDSQILYGRRTHQRFDYQNNSDSEVEFLADRHLAAYKDLRMRVDSVTIAANDDPDNDDLNRLFYDARFGDLVEVKVDSGHGWEIERQAHIIGITDQITPDEWERTFTLDDAALAIGPEE